MMRISETAGTGTGPRPVDAPTHVSLRWAVSGEAVARVRPGLVDSNAKSDESVYLECEVAERATVTLRDGEGAVLATLQSEAPVLRVIDATLDQEHLEVPGVLSATVRRSTPHVLYARTSLLSSLGIGGGRYDAPIAG